MKTLIPIIFALFLCSCATTGNNLRDAVDSVSVGASGTSDAAGNVGGAITTTVKFRDSRHTRDNK